MFEYLLSQCAVNGLWSIAGRSLNRVTIHFLMLLAEERRV